MINRPLSSLSVAIATLAMLLAAALLWKPSHGPAPNSNAAEKTRSLPALNVSAAPERVQPAGRPIRVNVTPSGQDSALTIRSDEPWQIVLAGTQRELNRGRRLPESRLSPTGVGIQMGSTSYPSSRIEIRTVDPRGGLWVNDHKYRGSVRILRRPGNQLLLVNVLDIEHYVASVVDGEMPAAFGQAAREAQAVVARTYALYQQIQRSRTHPFDVFSSTRSQKYLGLEYLDRSGRRLAGETDAGRRAANRTRGIVCRDSEGILCSYYSAVCGGSTTAGRRVFGDASALLVARECTWCSKAALYRWTREFDLAVFDQAVAAQFRSQQKPWDGLTDVQSEPGSNRLLASDGRRQYVLDRNRLRTQLGSSKLPSPRFSVSVAGEIVNVRGRGHGHGVGLCQWGAHGLASAGRSMAEILQFYYPGVQLVRLDHSR